MRTRITVWLLAVLLGAGAQALDPPGAAVPLGEVELDRDTLRVHFIDVGAGLAMLVQTPGNRKTLFVDGGDEGGPEMIEYVSHFVNEDEIDSIFITHADQDHFFNSRHLLDRYKPEEFVNTGYTSPTLKKRQRWTAFLKQVRGIAGIAYYVPAEDFLPLGFVELYEDGGTPGAREDDVTITYLNVDKQPPTKDLNSGRKFNEAEQRNNASLVFKLQYGETSFLITGDINGRVKEHEDESDDDEIDSEEFELLRHHQDDPALSLESTVLQLPHHGSNGSCSLPFLNAVSPEWVVIPAGHRNDHPTEGAIRRLGKAGVPASQILRTDDGDPIIEDDATEEEPAGDDSYVFVVDEDGIRSIIRIKVP
jgi:competence protein ComEC